MWIMDIEFSFEINALSLLGHTLSNNISVYEVPSHYQKREQVIGASEGDDVNG